MAACPTGKVTNKVLTSQREYLRSNQHADDVAHRRNDFPRSNPYLPASVCLARCDCDEGPPPPPSLRVYSGSGAREAFALFILLGG